ncbi:hypothetical protein [Trueperella pyogenes]
MSSDETKYPVLAEFDRFASEINVLLRFADDYDIADVHDWIKDYYGIDMDDVEAERRQLLDELGGEA